MAGFRVGIRNGPERGLTAGAATRTVREPPRGEGWDLDEVRGEREAARRGNLADSAQLWAMSREGDAAARCALIECYVPLATRIAHGMNVPVGAVAGPDDLESAALIGLIDAVDRFQPERGVPFEGYASLRIRGAVLDEVRRVDELGRADRRRQREAAAQGEEGSYQRTVSLDELIENGYHGGAEQDELAERYEPEGLRAQLEPSDVGEPDRKTQWTQQPDDRVVARIPGREDPGQVVEQRVRDRLELGKPVAQLWRVRGERSEPVVLPADVVAALTAMRDPQPALTWQTDEPAVSEQRAEDDLELDRVRWDTA